MFFFGLAFLLLETKSVTEMNLVWGSTWLTSAVVFSCILMVIMLATLLMRWRPLPWSVGYSGLLIALILNYLTPVHSILSTSTIIKLLMSLLFVGTPIFFAAICFALLFRDAEATDLAYGWNVLGAVIGGLILVGWIILRARRGEFTPLYYTPVAVVGLYWSFVDMVWIVLYPLIYLVGRGP
jgi:hypothetical protein